MSVFDGEIVPLPKIPQEVFDYLGEMDRQMDELTGSGATIVNPKPRIFFRKTGWEVQFGKGFLAGPFPSLQRAFIWLTEESTEWLERASGVKSASWVKGSVKSPFYYPTGMPSCRP